MILWQQVQDRITREDLARLDRRFLMKAYAQLVNLYTMAHTKGVKDVHADALFRLFAVSMLSMTEAEGGKWAIWDVTFGDVIPVEELLKMEVDPYEGVKDELKPAQ